MPKNLRRKQNNPRCIIWGAGGHAKVVAEILRLQRREIVGFLDSLNPRRRGERFFGSRILGGAEQLQKLSENGIKHAIVAFGDNELRVQAGKILSQNGFTLIQAIHPNACCARDAVIGAGTVIAPGAVLGPTSQLGENVIVNTSASLDHDCRISPGVHLGPGSILAGNVRVHNCAWVGAGAVIIEGREIGARSVVGAGSVVIRDVGSDLKVAGVPAAVLQKRS